MVYFVGDTHFGDKNIISFENRPFEDVEKMDEFIIIQWNSVVSDTDKVFHVGDFSAYDKEKNKEILSRLNGKKCLIMGNHDTNDEKYYRECGFDGVYKYPIVFENFFIISHEPMYINTNMPYANIYGHVHANPTYKDFSSRSFCVCVERNDYTPFSFDEIRKKIVECDK